jgi:hypothetical protein
LAIALLGQHDQQFVEQGTGLRCAKALCSRHDP